MKQIFRLAVLSLALAAAPAHAQTTDRAAGTENTLSGDGIQTPTITPPLQYEYCMETGDMAKHLLGEMKLAYTATSITNRGTTMQLYTQRDGRWVVVEIDNNLKSCVLHRGIDWTWAVTTAK